MKPKLKEKLSEREYCKEFCEPEVLNYNKHIIGIGELKKGLEFYFIFSDKTRTKLPTHYSIESFNEKVINPIGS